ncbi:PIN-like domain-containing protein, partial [Yersinia enterocolitica]
MKDGFKGFYNPNGAVLEAIWNSQNTIFVFDTNVYLNIYSYAEKTKLDLFSVLEKIKKNLWVPNHVALEYQKRRLDVIDRERGNFTKITNVFNKFNNQINVEIIQNLGIEKKLPDLHKSLDDFLLKFNSLCDDFVKGVFEEQKKLKPDVRSSDEIRKKLDSILSGKVGQSFTQSELDEIYEEGEVRFANKIPPGFKDAGKDGDSSDFTYMSLNYKRKFGDFIIWKQLIKEASKEEIKNVVFITDDKKNDWWYGVGDKIIGPQEKLQSEFYSLTGVDTFKMYDTVDFLKDAVVYLGTKVDEKSFDDVKKTSSSVIINSASTDTSDLIGGHTVTSNNNASDEIDNSKESEMEDGVPLKEYLDIHETIRLSLGFESLREQEEAIRRSLGYDSIREQEEAIRRSLGVESLRKREEAIRRSLG